MPEIVDNKIENSEDKSSYVTRGAVINCSLDVKNFPLDRIQLMLELDHI